MSGGLIEGAGVTEELEAKLRALIDRQEIHDLLLRYARGLDRQDAEMVRACYWDDAVDDHHTFVGRPGPFVDWAIETTSHCAVQHHGVTNHLVELHGDDAHGESYYTFIGTFAQAPHMMSIGRYVEHYQRRGGVWKIANRVCVVEKLFALQDLGDGTSEEGDLTWGALVPATRDRDDLSYQRPVKPRQPLD
ncbi:MAG: nuclear transport factor 2 family protein [Sphingomonadales bacterium]|nr:MAG: nuclear transport factor 2 family protein [Sphingomonadales bacterium]